MSVLFKNPLGITFERTDYKNRSKVKVHNDGYNLRTYRFNNISCFESTYISWANLDCCGGWATSDEYLKTAVQNGQKLFASIVHPQDQRFESSDEVIVDTRNHGWIKDYCITHISRKGNLSNYYNIDSVLEHYSRLGITFTVGEIALIREYCNVELSVFGTEEAPFDYAHITEIEQYVVTGLLLGYPLESTASLIEEWF